MHHDATVPILTESHMLRFSLFCSRAQTTAKKPWHIGKSFGLFSDKAHKIHKIIERIVKFQISTDALSLPGQLYFGFGFLSFFPFLLDETGYQVSKDTEIVRKSHFVIFKSKQTFITSCLI